MSALIYISYALLWIIVIINFIITLAMVQRLTELLNLAKGNQRTEKLAKGEAAPSINLVRANGKGTLASKDLHTSTLLVFTSASCQPCREVLPQLDEMYYRARNDNIEIVIVNLEDEAVTKTLIEELAISAPTYYPTENSTIVQDYKISSTPSFYLIDDKGNIVTGGRLGKEWNELTSSWKSFHKIENANVNL